MIRILGIRRVIALAVLLGLNGLLGAVTYLYLIPAKAQKTQILEQTKSEISTHEADISRMQIEFDEIQKQKSKFQKLVDDGFFRDQSRREAEDVLNRVQKASGVISAVASISPGQIKDNAEATKANQKILQSTLGLKIQAPDDVTIYNYLYMLQHNFPGYLTYEKLDMKRVGNVNATVLRGIASGSPVSLVEAEIELTWKTMIPDPNYKPEDNPDPDAEASE